MEQKDVINNETEVPSTPLRFLIDVSRPHAFFAVISIVAVTLGQICMSLNPFILKNIVDGFTSNLSYTDQIELFSFWALVYVALMIGAFIFWRTSGFVGMEWLSRANKTAYSRLYGYLSDHSHGYFSNNFAGALSNKVSNASDGSEHLLERILWGWYPEVIALVMGSVLLFQVDQVIAVAFLAVFLVMFLVNMILVRFRRPHVVAYAKSSSKLRGDGVDYITNITAARQYVRTVFELGRINATAEVRREKDVRQWRMSEYAITLNNVVVAVLVSGALYYVYTLLLRGSATPGDVVLVLTVLGRMTMIILFLGNAMNGFIRMYGEIQEGLETILVPHEVNDAQYAKDLVVHAGGVEFTDVDFEFDNNPVFNNFNLSITAGQRVGLVGPSGAGKTTFVSLLLRQHDLGAGSITIDGQNISEITQDSLRSNIAVVPQEPALFHRSIRENIAYGNPDATEDAIIDVAKKAEAHDFITSLPEGYETLVGERGVKLSGGQKQRVAIARALLKNSPILVLDEATSALDSESEVAIQKALRELMEEKTVVAIAHRLSTLREMDRILVVENGQIVEDGTHESLLKQDGTYARLWNHQAGGFLQD